MHWPQTIGFCLFALLAWGVWAYFYYAYLDAKDARGRMLAREKVEWAETIEEVERLGRVCTQQWALLDQAATHLREHGPALDLGGVDLLRAIDAELDSRFSLSDGPGV